MKSLTKSKTILFLGLFAAVGFQCKKDEPTPITAPPVQEEEELITTMQLVFSDSAGLLSDETFIFKDADGAGGNAPSIFDTIKLQANTTYNVQITLLNESVSPSEDITVEVQGEADEHLFCFTPSISGNCTIVRTDTDGTYELGLSSKWTTLAQSLGMVQVKLKHQPGVKDGTCTPGETDIEIDFPFEIQ